MGTEIESLFGGHLHLEQAKPVSGGAFASASEKIFPQLITILRNTYPVYF